MIIDCLLINSAKKQFSDENIYACGYKCTFNIGGHSKGQDSYSSIAINLV